MTTETLYVALPFKRTSCGQLSAQESRSCSSREQAAAEAARLGVEFGGAIAFSRSLDSKHGVVGPAELIHITGELPRLDYLLGEGPQLR